MKRAVCLIDPVRRRRLEVQGYRQYTDAELYNFRIGLRFAYFLCGSFVLLGLILKSPAILTFATVVALFGSILPRHPFDYLYNHAVRKLLNYPAIPLRPNQGRFACGIASVWVSMLIYLMMTGLLIWAYVAGGILLFIASLVSFFDVCIPSMVYNYFFERQRNKLD